VNRVLMNWGGKNNLKKSCPSGRLKLTV